MRHAIILTFIILVVAALLGPAAVLAGTIIVDNDGPADFNNIQAAIIASNDGDIIEVQPGIYTGAGNRDIDFGGKAITVRSTNGPDSCIIDCNSDSNNLHRGFYFHTNEDANSILDGFKIKNGQEEFGGGVYCNNSSPLIKNCIFTENLALKVEITETLPGVFYTDYYGKGGGVCFSSGSMGKIVNCKFYNNSAYFGGNAIHCDLSGPVIEECTLTENHGSMRGGAIYVYKSCARVVNCLIANNSSVEYGGAIAFKGDYHTSDILNCTITGNSSGRGGAFDMICSTANITNCILWENSSTEITYTATGTVNVKYSDIQGGWVGAGNINVDPLFIGSDDYHLVSGSPCIDSATNNPLIELPLKDIDGTVRPLDGDNDGISTVDMGAYEFDSRPVADAGPNQVVYAWIDDVAEVVLDANESYDPDGDLLTYDWSWVIDSNVYEANGVSAVIELGVGEYEIALVVNDGMDNSEPDYVTVEVVGAMEGTLRISPATINRHSNQKRVLAILELADVTKEQIDSNEVLVMYAEGAEDGVEAIRQFVFQYGRGGYLRVCVAAWFDKDELMGAIADSGRLELEVAGRLTSGQYFYGADSVLIKNKRISNHLRRR